MAKKRKLEQNDVVSPPESPPPPPPPTLSHDDLLQIIKPFTHSQLSEIVITASLRHPDVIESIRSIADVNPSRRSLSIQNLDQSTTTKRLAAFFAKFGELEKAEVVQGKISRKCIGYVVYKHVDSALLALKEPSKLIAGKIAVVKLVDDVGKSKKAGLGTVDVSLRRVYIGNVDEGMNCEKLLGCFEKYGEIEEGPGGFDKETRKFRGVAFIVYRNVEGVKACLVDPVKVVDGRKLCCRLDVCKEEDSVQGGRGGRVLGVGDEGLGKGKLETVDVSSRRVCVGNVPAEMDCGKLLKHFEMYGEIEDGPLGFDRKTGKFKGFAFIVYRNVEGVKACLVDPVKIIDGHKLDCRLAVSKQGNLSGVAASQVVTAAQVPGLGDGGNTEVVISKQKSSKKDSLKNRVIAKENLETVDVSLRRVYIRKVPTKMECEKLLEHFSMYGEVEGGPLRFVNKKGKFRGKAFIIYKNVDGAKACLVDPVKIVDGHELSCRLAIPRKGLAASAAPALGSGDEGVAKSNLKSVDVSSRKVYVGNVPHGMKREKLLAHFSLYGEVEDEPLGFHRKAKCNDGFAFIVYKNVEGAKACLVDPIKTIDGYQLHCRLAIPRKWNPSTVTAPAATAAQVQGSDNRGKRKFVNLEEQSSMQSSFVGGGRSGVSDYVGNMGGLGLPAGPYAHGISGYGGGGHGQPLEHSQHVVNLNLGGGFGLTSSLSNCGRPGLGLFSFGRNDGGQAPIGGGNGSSHFGGFGTSYDGTGSDGGVGPGNGANYGGTRNGEGAELGTGASYGGMHNGGGMGLGTGFGAPSSSYGGMGTGGVGLGIGFGGSSHISHYGLSPGYVRMSSEGYSESANYSLSSGSTDQAQQQHKKYQACYLNYK